MYVSFSKNPVGLNQVIDMMGLALLFSLVSLLNANYADGIDVSWFGMVIMKPLLIWTFKSNCWR